MTVTMSVVLLVEFQPQPSPPSTSSLAPSHTNKGQAILKLNDRRFGIDLLSVSSYYYPDSIPSTLSCEESFAWAVATKKSDEFWARFVADDEAGNARSFGWFSAKSYYDDGCLDSGDDDEGEVNKGKDEVDGRQEKEKKNTCDRWGGINKYERAAHTRARMFERSKRKGYDEREAMARYEYALHYEVFENYKTEMRFYEEFREKQGVYVPRMLATVEADATPSGSISERSYSERFFKVPGILVQYIDGFELSLLGDQGWSAEKCQEVVQRVVDVVREVGEKAILRDHRTENVMVERET